MSQFSICATETFLFQRFPYKSDFASLMFDKTKYNKISYEMIAKASELYGKKQWILFEDQDNFEVFKKIYEQQSKVSEKFTSISQGIATGKDELYMFKGKEQGEFVLGTFIKDNRQRKIETGILRPLLKGKDIQRYQTPQKALYILFPYVTNENGKSELMTELEVKKNFPNAYLWLKETEKIHRKKDNKSTDDINWFRYARNQGVDHIEQNKICSMEICVNHTNALYDIGEFYHNTKVYSWYKSSQANESYEYYLAIANSRLLWWFLCNTGDTLQGDARTMKTNYLFPFPLPKNVTNEDECRIIKKVNEVIKLKKEASKTNTLKLEAEIDQLVYKLYDLTEEEIKIVEGV